MKCPMRAREIGEIGVKQSAGTLEKAVSDRFRWNLNHHEMQDTSPEEIPPGDRFQMSYSITA